MLYGNDGPLREGAGILVHVIMGPVQNNLVARLERGDLLQDGGVLEDGLVGRIHVNHQLFLLLIAIFARLPVIQVLDDPEGGEKMFIRDSP